MPAVRKTVSIDALRQFLGDNRTDELLEKLRPAEPTVPVNVQGLSLARTLYTDPITESNKWAETIPVVRRYFLERGQARRAFVGWLDQTSATAADGPPSREAAPRRRRKVTDPAVLERRRAALAKAREARRQNLAQERRTRA